MKFKLNNGDRELIIIDQAEDFLIISHPENSSHIYIGVNEGVSVQLTKRRALAIAKAIIEELT